MNKNNVFYKYRNDNEFQKLLKEEREILNIAIEIAQARKRKKMTQVDLAKKAGMPQSQIARIESGSHNVTLQNLSKIAIALNMRIAVV